MLIKGSCELKGTYERRILLDNVTATTTSPAFFCPGAKKATLRFVRSNHSAGSTTFTVEATLNGDDWFTYNFLIDHVTNTNAQNITRVASEVLNSNSSVVVGMDLQNIGILAFRVVATETTDGTHYAEALVEF